ncbi:hypothetical protein [Clostridium ihumii]|nr:hypothetical protein [Clostridium ihumii]
MKDNLNQAKKEYKQYIESYKSREQILNKKKYSKEAMMMNVLTKPM